MISLDKYSPIEDYLFNLRAVFFSRRGSYLSFTRTDRNLPDGLYLRHVRGGLTKPEIFQLSLYHQGQAIPFTEVLTPTLLRLESDVGFVDICFEKDNLIRFAGSGITLRLYTSSDLSEYDTAWQQPQGDVQTIHYAADIKCLFTALTGRLNLDATWLGMKTQSITVDFLPDASDKFDVTVHTFLSTPQIIQPFATFADAHQAVVTDFDTWQATSLPTAKRYDPARELATYINWASMVEKRGNFTRSAMLMSKNWMTKIWGWDNCFNALAHVEQNPQLAWDQLMLFVDHQLPDGALVDHITDLTTSSRFYKPPIYGWAIRKMEARSSAITDTHLTQIYAPLCRWTEWWFTYRDDDGDGLPQYNHGNESGWDNGTTFINGVPVESPDLAAYLIIQMDFLAEVANRLGYTSDRIRWSERAATLQMVLINQLWTGNKFIARHAFTHEPYDGDSLLSYMPLLLGDRLPDDIRRQLVADVQRFITPHGLATEHPESPYYTDDGYWRGPIWAPSTFLIVDGLLTCGADEIARDIARRFCDLALLNGMAENYDALTGRGLRDQAYTWTSSVFLLLANWLK